MSYGTRYLELRDFIRYCEKLNVKVDKEELEYYEAKGIMLPMARMVVPEEYVKRMHEWLHTSTDTPRPDEWPEIDRLYDRPLVLLEDYAQLTDEKLVHPFDREFGRNPYLVRPDLNNYRPWDSYRVVVEHHDNYDVRESAATHYYSYWQVHQLYEIQKYPDLYENRFLIDNLPDEFKKKHRLPRALNLKSYRSFHGYAHLFDALSFYITMYDRERKRTFAQIPEQYGVRTLDVKQYEEYLRRLSAHAKFVADKYCLKEHDLYTFLVRLLNLHSDYQRAERLKLARELEKDIDFLAKFIAGVTGQSFDEIAEEVGKRNPLVKREFRHLDRAVQVLDYAQDTFERLMNDYNKGFPGFNISITEIDGLLKFIEASGLFIIPYAIFDTDEALNNPRAFRRTSLYMGMKNLTTGLECLIREIAKKIPNATGSIKTLDSLIQMVFSEWHKDFQRERGRKPIPKQPSDFIRNIINIHNDPFLDQQTHGGIIRVFLTAYWARNLTAHHYTLEDELYGDLYSKVYRAIYYAMLYTWKYAMQKGWVT